MGYGYGWMHGGWGFALGLLLWVAVVLALVLAVRALAVRRGEEAARVGPRETPLEILQARYARGDISREEYEQKRRDLSGGGT